MRKCPDTPSSAFEDNRPDVASANAQIATKLKALYSEIEQEPIPDLFLDLLEQLEQVEKAKEL